MCSPRASAAGPLQFASAPVLLPCCPRFPVAPEIAGIWKRLRIGLRNEFKSSSDFRGSVPNAGRQRGRFCLGGLSGGFEVARRLLARKTENKASVRSVFAVEFEYAAVSFENFARDA